MFISFEGIDKSGKTTQVNLLADFLLRKNYQVVSTREPGGTAVGREIKEIILKDFRISPLAELLLYLADRCQHVEEVIKPALRMQKIVISDRFADASLAYQGYGRGLSIELIEKFNELVTGGVLPDITFLLDLEPEKAVLRAKKKDRIEEEKLLFHRKVKEGYLEIAKSNPHRIRIIKADITPSRMHEMIKNIICSCLLPGLT